MAKKKRRIWLWIVLIVLAALLLGGWLILRSLGQQLTEVDYKTYTAAYGTVTRSITSSGRLAAGGSVSVQAESGIAIESICVKQGDAVQSGDVLAAYDPQSIQTRIDALYEELSTLDSRIRTRAYKDTITAPAGGRVKAVYAAVGDDLETVMKEHGALILLSSDDKMQVTIRTAETLSIGKKVTVLIDGTKKVGTVADVHADGYLITIPDSNLSEYAAVEVLDGDQKLGEGVLTIHAPLLVYGTGGTVETVHVQVNQSVAAGAKLFTLADKPVSGSYADLLQQRVDTADAIADLYALQENPVLVAPADGVVALVGAQEGAEAKGDAFTLHTGGAVKMSVAVDELDIDVVSLGQTANITLDAFSGESFSAKVTHISRLGTPSGSITTYAVELTLEPDPRFLEGMNGSATIIAQQKDDALLIPVEAIYEDETGVYVYVQTEDGAVRREIATGLSDGFYAEIVSGLSAGEVVKYQGTYVSLIEQYQQMSWMGRGES